jgi:hypothetical protein
VPSSASQVASCLGGQCSEVTKVKNCFDLDKFCSPVLRQFVQPVRVVDTEGVAGCMADGVALFLEHCGRFGSQSAS